MPLPYLGTIFLTWTIFVGGLTSVLVHVENSRLSESVSIVPQVSSQEREEANGGVDISFIAKKAENLKRSIATSHIAERFASSVDGTLGAQEGSDSASSSASIVEVDDAENSVVGNLLGLFSKKSDYSLKVDIIGDGHVIYSSGSICGGVCSVAYHADSVATLIATPGPDSTFAGWGGACKGKDVCTVKMNDKRIVSATFTKLPSSELKNTLPKQPVVTEAEVTRHATQSDCWIIVSQKVYAVSSYLSLHPGGKSVIVKMCGKDATAVFTDRGGTGAHSRSAWSLLGTFIVGVLPSFDQTKVSAVKEYTPEDVARHASPADCWISILDSVYSVSSYIALHPGGRLNIERVCGKDATEVFNNRDSTGTHSAYAWSLLKAYLVGALTISVPTASISNSASTTKVTTVSPVGNSSEFTLSQIAAHSTKTDCWIIVSDNIYSVGSYIAMHPGGTSVITNLCGKDATNGFTTRGGTGAHSGSAWTMLGSYFVGVVAGTVPAQVQVPNTPTSPSVTPTPPPNVSSITYSLLQVAAHATQADCWIIVSNNIYSVSSYITMHPGGMNIITGLCGKDATNDFTTRAGTGSHSTYAWGLLGGYLIGSVGAASTVIPPTPTPAPSPTPAPTPTPTATFTLAQIATHATQSDCWIVVSNNIYSIGSYLAMHPGGIAVITPSCGKEATTAFTTKNKGSSHSTYAWGLLGGYIVGSVTGTTPAPVPAPVPTPTPTPTPTPSGGPYTAAQIGTHATQSDCWIVIGTNVYSVGSYTLSHPGGVSAITNLCGKDATTAFATKNGLGAHSSYAQSLLGGYLVGALSGPPPSSTPTPTPTSSTYTATQISSHSSVSDCWIVIGTNVYSVGAYLTLHPGGGYAISKYCGKNATTAFGNRGGTGTHSAAANLALGGFLIGTLSGTAPASTPVNPAPSFVYNQTDVAAHSSPSDCWIIVSGSVYSVAPYVSLHPGGRTRITNLCGKDATTSFNNVGHSTKAKGILGGLLIGTYSATVSIPPSAVNGVCGPANNTSVSLAPLAGLCAIGTASSVFGSGPFTWSCTGSNGGVTASCSATLASVVTPPSPIDGVCGAANNTSVSSAPTTGLCTLGTASSVSGSGPFTWSCAGSNGGVAANCSATKTVTVTPQTYSVTVTSSLVLSSSGMTLNTGDKVVFTYTSGSGEAKISVSPSSSASPASFTLDKDITTKTVTISASGVYTFIAR